MRFGQGLPRQKPYRIKYKDPRQHPWISYIGGRLQGQFNQNWLALYTGGTGSGKTYGSLRTAEQYYDAFKDKPFKKVLDRNVFFSAKDFVDRVQNGRFEKGDLLIWDEAGVGVNSREWYSISNKAIVYILQTFRHLNLGVIFTTPSISYIDKAVRPLFHNLVVFKGSFAKIDYAMYSVSRVYSMQNDQFQDKIYYRTPYFKFGNQYRGLAYLYFSLPGRKVRKEYELRKEKFSEELRKELQATMDEIGKTKTKKSADEVFKELSDNATKYFYMDKNGKFKADIGRIMKDFKIGQADARVISKSVLRMGVGDKLTT